jgi:Kef-type K+ transport system membrane component KefB
MQGRNYRYVYFYSGVTGFFLLMIFFIVRWGHRLEEGRAIAMPRGGAGWEAIFHPLETNLEHPLTLFLLQIIIILLVSRIFGWLCRLIRQPSVIGEIIAGIVLGPSLTGLFFPEFFNALFPASSLGNLSLLSQIGLILFMFIVGTELDFSHLKNNISGALVISHASIVVPYGLGMGLALLLYSAFAPGTVSFLSFSLFLGISMSITAFPVLARIVQETGISRTRLGTMVITCAAIDDVTAWSLLAMVIAIVKAGSLISSLYTILLSVLYVLVMFKVVRPFLARIGDMYPSRENLSKPVVALFFLVVLISSLVTEMIGIHAIFGGFMAGVIMPTNEKFRNTLVEKVEDVSLVLFLPLFFVYTGLRTEIGLLNEPSLWGITLLIIATATAGKFLGGALSARFTGQGWRDSLMIGTLMNTRGLVELVVLNIGFDLGILDARIFAMLVIMALVTTFMTGPVLELIGKLFKPQSEPAVPESAVISGFRILLSFGNPETGRSLLRLASLLNHHGSANKTRITALHLTPADELFQNDPEIYEKESFAPLIEESLRLDEEVTTLFKISNDLETDITEIANNGGFNLLLIGVGQSVFEGSLLGKALGYTVRILDPVHFYSRITGKEKSLLPDGLNQRTRNIISGTQIPTGVLIDRKNSSFDVVFVYLTAREDLFLLRFFPRDHHSEKHTVTIIDPGNLLRNAKEGTLSPEQDSPGQIPVPDHFSLLRHWPDFGQPHLEHSSLLVVSMEAWNNLQEMRDQGELDIPGILMVAEPSPGK